MKTAINLYFRLLEAAMVLCLAAMCVMVFGNVLLRYAFDSGISSSEELSGFLFIWLTFLGAIVALREDGHLGVHMLVRRLTGASLLTVNVLAQGIVLLCSAVFLWGLLSQYPLHASNRSLLTDLPMTVAYGGAYLCAASGCIMSAWQIFALLTGRQAAGVPLGECGYDD